jgi:hypothetical protein
MNKMILKLVLFILVSTSFGLLDTRHVVISNVMADSTANKAPSSSDKVKEYVKSGDYGNLSQWISNATPEEINSIEPTSFAQDPQKTMIKALVNIRNGFNPEKIAAVGNLSNDSLKELKVELESSIKNGDKTSDGMIQKQALQSLALDISNNISVSQSLASGFPKPNSGGLSTGPAEALPTFNSNAQPTTSATPQNTPQTNQVINQVPQTQTQLPTQH